MTADLVHLGRPADGVAVLTLNRPAKYNALSTGLLTALHDRLGELAGDPGLRAVVLTGADPAFCAGLDLTEFGAGAEFPPDGLGPLLALGVPVIGAVNGVAITGGLELALACDVRIASERARFAARGRLRPGPRPAALALLAPTVG
jgi:enoyl-CoA hydratase